MGGGSGPAGKDLGEDRQRDLFVRLSSDFKARRSVHSGDHRVGHAMLMPPKRSCLLGPFRPGGSDISGVTG